VTRRGVSPTEIVEAWSESGPVVRVPTGIAPLDDLCRGGIAIPRRVMIVGAPSAGKTALAAVVAMSLAQHHVCVGILAVDEDPDDVTMRLAQMLGHAIADMERCDEVVLAAARASLSACRVRLYDATWSVKAAAADVASWARVEGMPAALVVDSVQTARADACATAPTAREHVETVVAAIRDVSTQYSMLVIATSEANRASYRSDDAAREGNDLAAGAESRAIEYGAQTQVVLRTPRGHGDVIHVRVAKNRRADRGEFWLHLDHGSHSLAVCDDPDSCEAAPDPDPDAAQADAVALAEVLAAYPDGLGVRELRRDVRRAGHRWGHARLDAAVSLLVEAGRAEDTRCDGTRRGGPARIRLLPHDPLEDV
jgi:KaiC/GvpD/RAD55 family RecA-like ATPase